MEPAGYRPAEAAAVNDIIRLPVRLRVVSDPIREKLAREKPRFFALHLARRHLIETWRQLISSDEMTDIELREVAELTSRVLLQLLDLHRLDHPAQPDQTPPSAA